MEDGAGADPDVEDPGVAEDEEVEEDEEDEVGVNDFMDVREGESEAISGFQIFSSGFQILPIGFR